VIIGKLIYDFLNLNKCATIKVEGFKNWKKVRFKLKYEKPPNIYKMSKLGLEVFSKRKKCSTLVQMYF
jgi:hypothetical protein